MAFTFKPVNTIKKNVSIEVPGDFGKTSKADFDVEYKRLPVSDARSLIEDIKNKTADEEAVLRDCVVNIQGIKDVDGNDIEFSSELLTKLIEEIYIRGPILAGFMDVNYSLDKLRAKNS